MTKSSIRTLQLPYPLIQILDEHRKRQESLKDFHEGYFICGATRSLRDSSLQNKSKLYAKMSGIDVIRVHDFRHSHASILINARINIKEVARRLGHAKVEETWNTYAHMYPQEEEKAMDVLNEVAA